MMDFHLSAEQEALRDSVLRFVEREYDWERRQALVRSPQGRDPAHWGTFAELGWLGAGLGEAAGGFGGGIVEDAVIAEQLGRGLVTEPFLAHVVASHLLAGADGESVAQTLASTIMGETIVVPALQEPAGRGNHEIVETTVQRDSDGWLLTGAKSLVEGGAVAARLIVSARDQQGGIGLYLVDPAAAGIDRRDYRTIDNRRVSDFHFTGVRLEPTAALSAGADTECLIESAIDRGTVAMCSEALGIMDAALWSTRDYLRTRKQFGVAIGTFQVPQHRMADMLIEVELMRSILFTAMGAIEQEDANARRRAVSAAKVQLKKGGLFVTAQAIQLYGGIGVTEELKISHFYKRLYVMARQFGDEEFHLNRFVSATDAPAA